MPPSVPRSSVLDRLMRGAVLRITKHAPDHFTAVVEERAPERSALRGATETEVDPLTAFRIAGFAGVGCVADHGAEKVYAWVGVPEAQAPASAPSVPPGPSGDGQATKPPVLARPQPASKPAPSRSAPSQSGGLSLGAVMDAAERLAARFSTPRLPCEVVSVRRDGVALVVRMRGPELARLGVADGLSTAYGREVLVEASPPPGA